MAENYFTQWRSKVKCQAMVLDEETALPVDPNKPDVVATQKFAAGDYMVRQDGQVFGRTKADHEALFEPTRKMKVKATGKAKKVVRKPALVTEVKHETAALTASSET